MSVAHHVRHISFLAASTLAAIIGAPLCRRGIEGRRSDNARLRQPTRPFIPTMTSPSRRGTPSDRSLPCRCCCDENARCLEPLLQGIVGRAAPLPDNVGRGRGDAVVSFREVRPVSGITFPC